VFYKLQSSTTFELRQTETFAKWRRRLKDARARATIAARLDRLSYGHIGDAQPVGDDICELRIHYGPGYRIYFQMRGRTMIILLCGGEKSTQSRDIKAARRILAGWSEDDG
jgi:putative addiction module killer protein